ncbi:hypothetical protein AX15_001673 [Amanita polypyramis BW_CC]|nr:hypothetical protein AX15_001673 [Amanita polypyramis BW_CC]
MALQELVHRCAMYESENKVMREKVHDTHVRLADLEAELSRLKPWLTMQPPPLTQPPRHDPMRNSMSYPSTQIQSYLSPLSHVPSFTPAIPHVPFPPLPSSSGGRSQKRKGDDYLANSASGKGKEKEPTRDDISDGNADDDSDNTEVPPTPTPVLSSSHNPYAYMNNLYRQVFSSPISPLKPPGTLSGTFFSTPVSSPSGAMSLNHFTVAYPPYPCTMTAHSKSLSASAVVQSSPSRSDHADKCDSQIETSAEVHDPSNRPNGDQPSPSKTPSGSTRRLIPTSTRRTQHQGKYKTSSILSDARAEHLLLAARRIGRERAAMIAGLIKVQDKPIFEESGKDKAKGKDARRHLEARHSSMSTNRSTQQRRRMIQNHSPSTPTPRRVHGYTQLLTGTASLTTTPNTSRSRDTLYKTPRTKSSNTVASSKEEESLSATQSPLDSLLSAARSMMFEDRGSRQIAAGQSTFPDVSASAEKGTGKRQSAIEDQDMEGVYRRKRRRNTIARVVEAASPKPRTEKHGKSASTSHVWESRSSPVSKRVSSARTIGSASVGRRARSALDVLADQAAVAFAGSPATSTIVEQEEKADESTKEPCDSEPCADPVANIGSIEISSIRDHPGATLTPHVEEGSRVVSVSTAAEDGVPVQSEDLAISGMWQERTGESPHLELQNTGAKETVRDNVRPEAAAGNEAAILIEDPVESVVGTKLPSVHSNFSVDEGSDDWDLLGGGPNTAIVEPNGDSEGDIDAEGDVDSDSPETVNGVGISTKVHSLTVPNVP